MQSFIPDLADKLALLPPSKRTRTEREGTVIEDLQWPSSIQQEETHPFSMSSRGQNYRSLGCFSLGIDCSANDFTGLVEGQRRLRDLNLLKAVTAEELRRIGGQLLALDEEDPSEVPRSIQELLDLLIPDDEEPPQLRIWIGLHSGFRTITGAQFWGLYDIDESGVTDLYISGFAEDVPGTILHTFLSSRGCPRAQCFMAEYVLHERCDSLADTWELPPRMVKDIEQLSPTESMLLLRRLALFDNREWASISAKVRACCEFQLLDVPEVTQLRALNATSYLRGQVSAEDLVTSRLDWYRERGCHSPNPVAAISLFLEIDSLLPLILLERKSDILTQLEMILHTVLHKKQIDAAADIFALAVFCAFRKLALNEVYMEILDRNPLPNAHPDQAACFAEMFALGSRCESYFDMTPTVIGKLLAERYQTYFKNHQPPQRDDSTTELPTAYASKQVDTDPNAGREKPPVYYEITFLGIFAVPALIDILLLTTIGRGLYVTAFMTEDEKTMATSALMVALLFCGAIGTWISSGGSYYLHSMAFAAMNMFVLTRLIAGIAITLAGGIMAMVVIGVIKGFYAGVIFFLYFFFLTTYLSLLATLAIYQMPGFMFQSVSNRSCTRS